MTFTENIYTPADSVLHLIVAPESRDTITVYNPQVNHTESFAVAPGKQNIIYLKYNYLWYSRLLGSQNTGVRITSRRPVQIQAVNRIDGSCDVASVYPIGVIENAREYVVNHLGGETGKEAQVAILAIDTGTTTIELNITADLYTGQGSGSIFTRTLKQGQVYILQALDAQNLSGTIIRVTKSCKRIVAFSGTKCTRFPQTSSCFSCDATYEQLLPVNFSQIEYFIPETPDNSKYTVAVTAQSNNTNVTINGVYLATLNRGQQVVKQVTGCQLINTDKPANCVQILHSSGCNGALLSGYGDPSVIQIPGSSQGVYEAYFPVLRSTKYKHYISGFSENNVKPNYFINGTAIPASEVKQFIISARSFWFFSHEVFNNNTYKLSADVPFVLFNYGMANGESYGTVCGASFDRTDADFTANPFVQCNKNKPVVFTALGDSLGQNFWDFGDGTTAGGAATSHIYGKSGVFRVKMVNLKNGSCPDTISRLITVFDGPDLNLPKDTMPCEGEPMRITLPIDKSYTYLWENGSPSFTRVFSSNQTAVITATDTNGCVSKDTIDVRFRECDDYDLRLANVFTPGNNGFNDEWKVYYSGYKEINVFIYNRWGTLVFKQTLPDDPHWNGNVDNGFAQCPDGVYFYRLVATARKSKDDKIVNGTIQLIRD